MYTPEGYHNTSEKLNLDWWMSENDWSNKAKWYVNLMVSILVEHRDV